MAIPTAPARPVSSGRVRHPQPRPVGPVPARRIALASVALVAVITAFMVAARALPTSGVLPTAVAVVLGLIVLPIVAAPLEWAVHRYVYHQPVLRPLATIFTVHTAHHYAFFPTWRYVTSGPARRLAIRGRAPDVHLSPARNAGVRLAHFGWYMMIGLLTVWIPGWFFTHNVAYLVGVVVSTAIVSNLFIVVHDTIHRPGSHRLVEMQPWYGFLDRHHYIHHVDLGVNLNFLLPLGDLLFGTLRTSLTADELADHGSLDEAKATRLGHGERARAAEAAA